MTAVWVNFGHYEVRSTSRMRRLDRAADLMRIHNATFQQLLALVGNRSK